MPSDKNTGFRILDKLAPPCTALVISAGHSPAAYDVLRSLGMEGITVSVASSERDDMAFYSRYCGEKLFLPDFEEQYYPQILNLLTNKYSHAPERPVLFYTSDPELTFVSRYRTELKEYFRFLLPEEETFFPLMNKARFVQFGVRHGLPLPFTRTFQSAREIRTIIDEVEFPCIVKPAYSQDWAWDTEEQRIKFGPYKKALRRFSGKEELLDFCEGLPERQAGILLQSYIDGRDETIVSFHGYFDQDSRCLGYFMGRKIRTYPMHTGGSAYIQTIHNDVLAQQSIEYLQRIGYTGITKIDYKWHQNKREFVIMEINPRYNLWELLGACAGMNLLHIAYRHQRGEDIPVSNRYADDARLLYFKQDLRGYWGGYRRTGEWTFGQYVRSLAHRSYFRVYDPKDVMPFLHSSLDFVRRNLRKLAVRFQRKPAARQLAVQTHRPHFTVRRHAPKKTSTESIEQ